ncbi:hypothetical protein BKA83DRAFT_4128077 [Pisolithus microcarpus]|nr:hypothetical protein BKA83DRAFT_4128077 [Pisolithus microcarpus]
MSSPLPFACSEFCDSNLVFRLFLVFWYSFLSSLLQVAACPTVKWGHSHLQLPFNFVLGFLPLSLSYVEFQQIRTSLCSPSFMATPPTSPEQAHDATCQSEHDQHTLGSPPQCHYPQAVAQPPPDLPQALLVCHVILLNIMKFNNFGACTLFPLNHLNSIIHPPLHLIPCIPMHPLLMGSLHLLPLQSSQAWRKCIGSILATLHQLSPTSLHEWTMQQPSSKTLSGIMQNVNKGIGGNKGVPRSMVMRKGDNSIICSYWRYSSSCYNNSTNRGRGNSRNICWRRHIMLSIRENWSNSSICLKH